SYVPSEAVTTRSSWPSHVKSPDERLLPNDVTLLPLVWRVCWVVEPPARRYTRPPANPGTKWLGAEATQSARPSPVKSPYIRPMRPDQIALQGPTAPLAETARTRQY